MTVVCIGGMHRSGTSLVARLLGMCGVFLGAEDELLGPATDNEEGFWEHRRFLEINEGLLAELGTSWDVAPPRDLGSRLESYAGPLEAKAEALIRRYDGHRIWGWKDPRNSLTLPFWRRFIPALKVINCLRNPLEVAESLAIRNQMPRAKAFELWEGYNMALRAPVQSSSTIITHYETWFDDPEAELQRLLGFLGVPQSTDLIGGATAAAKQTLKHHNRNFIDLLAEGAPVSTITLYAELCDAAGDTYRGLVDRRAASAEGEGRLDQYVLEGLLKHEPGLLRLAAATADRATVLEALSDRLLNEEQVLRESQRDLRAARTEIKEIYRSKSWRVAMALRQARLWFLPPDSPLANMLRRIDRIPAIVRAEGLTGVVRRLSRSYVYDAWIARHEPDAAGLAVQQRQAQELPSRPTISIITPVFNTPKRVLVDTIESVVNQTYDRWELCIANGSPGNAEVVEVLRRYANRDKRIKWVDLQENLGIAGNTNAAIAQATGDFIGFLDHDDLLAPFALFEVVRTLAGNSELDMLYSDEDKVAARSAKRFDPFFKPAFSPDFLRTNNYMPHFMVVRKSLGDRVGWLRPGFDGAQDYELNLRLAENARQIAHIPRILYHWRAMPGSTALHSDSKDYSTQAGFRALESHVLRMRLGGTVRLGPVPNTYRVAWRRPQTPFVSIIIPFLHDAESLLRCVGSVVAMSSYRDFEVVVVNAEEERPMQAELSVRLLQTPKTRVESLSGSGSTAGLPALSNYGAARSSGSVLVFAADQLEVITLDWIEQLLEYAQRSDVGIAAPMVLSQDDEVQHAGILAGVGGVLKREHMTQPLSTLRYLVKPPLVQNLPAVSHGCMMMRREVFDRVSGFDCELGGALANSDLCLKARRAGYLITWTPYAELYWYRDLSSGSDDGPGRSAEELLWIQRFRERWQATLESGDAYYNPNLVVEDGPLSVSKQADAMPRIAPGIASGGV